MMLVRHSGLSPACLVSHPIASGRLLHCRRCVFRRQKVSFRIVATMQRSDAKVLYELMRNLDKIPGASQLLRLIGPATTDESGLAIGRARMRSVDV
jgi:hypothetical protein